jgi:AmmeMemoRadiSam system protein A
VSASPEVIDLTDADRRHLVDVARRSVELGLTHRPGELLDLDHEPAHLRRRAATFVTLRRGEALLGCIGTMEPIRPLVDDVAYNASAAAFSDPRLPPVSWDDFREMGVKVSVLGPMQPMDVHDLADLAAGVRPGVDGLLIAAGRHRATFLPSVWEQVPDADTFLTMLWDKAGLRRGSWPHGLTVHRYQTLEFGDGEQA